MNLLKMQWDRLKMQWDRIHSIAFKYTRMRKNIVIGITFLLSIILSSAALVRSSHAQTPGTAARTLQRSRSHLNATCGPRALLLICEQEKVPATF